MAWSLIGWLLGGGIGLVGILVYLLVRYGKKTQENKSADEKLKAILEVRERETEISTRPATNSYDELVDRL